MQMPMYKMKLRILVVVQTIFAIAFLHFTTTYGQSNADTYTEIMQLGQGSVGAITWSPNGQFLAVATHYGIQLYTATFQKYQHLTFPTALTQGSPLRIDAIAWSPSGDRLAASGGGEQSDNVFHSFVQIWDASTLNPIVFITDVYSDKYMFAWHPDGTQIATTSLGVKIWDAAGGTLITTFETAATSTAVAWHWSGDILLGVTSTTVYLWDAVSGSIQFTLHTPDGGYYSLAWHPDGSKFALSHYEKIEIWEIGGTEPIAILQGHVGQVWALAWHGDLLASTALDDTRRIWNTNSNQLIKTEDNLDWAAFVTWKPDSTQLAFADTKAVVIWSDPAWQTIASLGDYTTAFAAVTWSPNGSKIATANHAIQLWNVLNGELLATFGDFGVRSVTWNASGSQLAATDGSRIQIWDITNMNLVLAIPTPVVDIAWHPNHAQIASISKDGQISIWDAITGQAISILGVHPELSSRITWSADGNLLAILGQESVSIWNVAQQTLEHILSPVSPQLIGLSWSPIGADLAIINGISVEIWNATAGTLTVKLINQQGTPLTAVAWSPRGTKIMSGSIEGQILVWDITTQAAHATLNVHKGNVTGLTWSPDGEKFGSVGLDARLNIYQVIPTLPPTDLRALYAAYNSAPITPVLHPSVVIRNHGNTPVPLSEVRLRYYFTRDGSADLQASCTFIPYYPSGVLPDIIPEPQACASSVIVETGALTVPTATADSYLEVRFTDGTLPANSYTLHYILSVNKADWSAFQQANDYSFSAFGTYPLPAWDKITLTRQGAAVWGAAPQ